MRKLAAAVLLSIGVAAGALAFLLPPEGDAAPGALVSGILPLVGVIVIAVAFHDLGSGWKGSWAAVRLLVYLALFACVLQVVRAAEFVPKAFFLRLHVALALGAAVLLVTARAQPRRIPTWLRVVDLVVGTLAILVIGAEVGLRVIATFSPTPVLAARDLTPEQRIRVQRYRPGTLVDGTVVNAHGFPAPAFERPADEGSRVVLLVSDRTLGGGLPAVVGPAAVASRRLRDAVVWPLALDGLSTPEYAHLLENVGVDLAPEAVIVVVDLGDDLVELQRVTGVWRPLALWLDRENSRLHRLLQRVRTAMDARAEGAAGAPAPGDATEPIETVAQAERELPWLTDPALEPVRGSRTALREAALATMSAPIEPLAERAAEDLAAMAQLCAAHGIVFGVALLPARHQVDDVLWDEVRGSREEASRDRQTAALRRRLDARAIANVDLTPGLRAAWPRRKDDARLFQREGTALSAQGARLVGEALAAFATDLLRRSSKR